MTNNGLDPLHKARNIYAFRDDDDHKSIPELHEEAIEEQETLLDKWQLFAPTKDEYEPSKGGDASSIASLSNDLQNQDNSIDIAGAPTLSEVSREMGSSSDPPRNPFHLGGTLDIIDNLL